MWRSKFSGVFGNITKVDCILLILNADVTYEYWLDYTTLNKARPTGTKWVRNNSNGNSAPSVQRYRHLASSHVQSSPWILKVGNWTNTLVCFRYVTHLPSEVLHHILSYIHPYELLKNVKHTCSAFHDVVESPSLWASFRTLVISAKPQLDYSPYLLMSSKITDLTLSLLSCSTYEFLSHMTYLRKLKIYDGHSWKTNNKHVLSSIASCKKLTHLEIINWSSVTETDIVNLSTSLPCIERFFMGPPAVLFSSTAIDRIISTWSDLSELMVYPNDDYESWALVIDKHFPRVRFGHILFLYVPSRLLNHRPEYYRM